MDFGFKFMKKLVSVTSFAEFHLLECLIPNIIQIINPDKIVISEGKMPTGPENKGFGNEDDFNQKWTFEGNGIVGFDWLKTKSLEEKYKGLVEVVEMNYDSNLTATECYIQSISNIEPELGDLCFCLESDSFLYEGDHGAICDELEQLKIGEGLSVKYVDFLQTQFFTENVNIAAPKFRRFMYKFDNLENYQRKMGQGYLTQNYPELKKVDSFFIRHYAWFRPNEYKQLRYDLIKRNDDYWKNFDIGLEWIKLKSEIFVKRQQKGNLKYEEPDPVMIRPSRNDEGRYVKFINISHPKHIENHENFIK